MTTTLTAASVAAVQPVIWLPIHRLRIDPNINRPLDHRRVNTIAEQFDPDAVGVLTVSARPDGSYVLLDGQHRLAALRQAGWDGNQQVPCDVPHGLSQAQEAALFVKLNNTAKPKYIHRFLRRITAGDPVAVDINRIATQAGFAISDQQADGHITAVKALEQVYLGAGTAGGRALQPHILAATLQVLTGAYGHTADAVNGHLIAGIGLLLGHYHPGVDTAALIRKLAKLPAGANGLLAKAKGMRDYKPVSLPRCVAAVAVEVYNHKRRNGRLDGPPF